MKTLRLALIWAAVGSITGVVIWSVVGGVLWTLVHRDPGQMITVGEIGVAVLGTAFWALFIGAAAFPLYAILFALWIRSARQSGFARWEERVGAAALLLAIPPAVVLTHGFAYWNGVIEWRMAAVAFPVALVSFWIAVWLPRRVVRSLRRNLATTAI